MSEWQRVRLGDVTTQVKDSEKVVPNKTYDLLGLRMWGGGAYLRESVDTTTSKAHTLYRATEGQFIYNRMFAWGGSFGVVTPEFDGCYVSNEFPLMAPDPHRLHVGFLRLYFQQPSVWAQIDEASTGTTRSRNRWKESLFAAHPIALPPLAEQRCIVDLMAVVDAQIEALKSQRAAAEDALSRLAIERVTLPGGDGGVALDSLLLRNIGGAWGSEPGTDDLDVDVYRSTEFTNWGKLGGFADAQRSVATSHHRSRALESGDILIEKSGGTPTRSVGRVVMVEASDLRNPTIGANFLQLLRADSSRVLPRYLFWIFWGAHRRGDGFDFQSASTNIRNLQTKAYLARRVNLPGREEQAAVAETLDAVQRAVFGVGAELAALHAYRSTLLSALISQQVEIPESYDALLDDTLEVSA